VQYVPSSLAILASHSTIPEQAAETWLKQFSEQISTDFDFTAIHVNKNNMDGVKADLVSSLNRPTSSALTRHSKNHYASYGKPIWVTEFACVDGKLCCSFSREPKFTHFTDQNGFTPCTDQGEINNYINQIVDLFESDGRVAAYAYRRLPLPLPFNND
jgi:hypothetical protein